jgi:hypothetical protein
VELEDYTDMEIVAELRRRLVALGKGLCFGCGIDLNTCRCTLSKAKGYYRSVLQVATALKAMTARPADAGPTPAASSGEGAKSEQPAA